MMRWLQSYGNHSVRITLWSLKKKKYILVVIHNNVDTVTLYTTYASATAAYGEKVEAAMAKKK